MLIKFNDLFLLSSKVNGIIHIGAHNLEELPDWYSYLLFLAVSASFGVKGVDKLMNLRKK